MFRLTTTGRALFLLILASSFSFSVKAQKDCLSGYKIYVRDEAGSPVENGKLEVKGLTEKDLLPGNAGYYVDKGGIYNINGLMGATVKGNFIFKISAAGYETYERRFNFPLCETQHYELRLRPSGSAAKAEFERLFILHGKVFDEDKRPFGNAKVEVRRTDGRIYQTRSNQYGYYEINLPKGSMHVRVTDERIPDMVFDDVKIEKNYSVLNISVCRKCGRKQS